MLHMRGVRHIRFTAETVKIGSKADDIDTADVAQIFHMAYISIVDAFFVAGSSSRRNDGQKLIPVTPPRSAS